MENNTGRTAEVQGPGTILEQIARQGAQQMLAQALEAEVAEFLAVLVPLVSVPRRRNACSQRWRRGGGALVGMLVL